MQIRTNAMINMSAFQAMLTEGITDGINIFGSALHTHLLGVGIKVHHYRSGVEQPVISEDMNYDFNFQESRYHKKETNVKPVS